MVVDMITVGANALEVPLLLRRLDERPQRLAVRLLDLGALAIEYGPWW